MTRARRLDSKITKLEKRTGINKLPLIPPQDCINFIEGYPEELEAKIEKRKAELVGKYDSSILDRVSFVIVRLTREMEGMENETG